MIFRRRKIERVRERESKPGQRVSKVVRDSRTQVSCQTPELWRSDEQSPDEDDTSHSGTVDESLADKRRRSV